VVAYVENIQALKERHEINKTVIDIFNGYLRFRSDHAALSRLDFIFIRNPECHPGLPQFAPLMLVAVSKQCRNNVGA
jgi:hypothetical protein